MDFMFDQDAGFFTRDDLNEFSSELEDALSRYGDFGVSESYMEKEGKTYIFYISIVNMDTMSEFEIDIPIDMRKIRRPSDLINKYLRQAVDEVLSTERELGEITSSEEITSGTSLKRIAKEGSTDNYHILRNWKKMTDDEAEAAAKQASLDDPEGVYYVAYDDVMNPSSEYRWKNGVKKSIYADEDVEVDGDEDYIDTPEQEFTSEKTSINADKLPALFKMVKFAPNSLNLDYGGGKFDNVTEFLAEQNVENLVYDPYNRSAEHNKSVLAKVRSNGGADTITCSNVLNVVKEPEVRQSILANIKKLLKPNGTVYITVYEGSGNNAEGPTKSGYQLNRKTENYLDEIRQVFPDAERRGKLITAHNGASAVKSSTAIEASANSQKLLSELNAVLTKTMKSFGFDDKEVPMYSRINISENKDGYIVIEVGAELGYDPMFELGDALDPIVQKYDADSYFDMDAPGLMTAFLAPGSIKIKSSEYIEDGVDVIQAAYYVPDHDLEPDDTEPVELDDDEALIDVSLDADIQIEEDGTWDFTDEQYPWVEDQTFYLKDDGVEIYLTDKLGVVERVSDIIEPLLPAEPGTYHVSGFPNLIYNITNRLSYEYSDYEYEPEEVDVSFDLSKSYVEQFKCYKISDSSK